MTKSERITADNKYNFIKETKEKISEYNAIPDTPQNLPEIQSDIKKLQKELSMRRAALELYNATPSYFEIMTNQDSILRMAELEKEVKRVIQKQDGVANY